MLGEKSYRSAHDERKCRSRLDNRMRSSESVIASLDSPQRSESWREIGEALPFFHGHGFVRVTMHNQPRYSNSLRCCRNIELRFLERLDFIEQPRPEPHVLPGSRIVNVGISALSPIPHF